MIMSAGHEYASCNFTALPLLPAKDTCPGGGADTGLKPVFKANRSHIHSNTPELFSKCLCIAAREQCGECAFSKLFKD